MGTSPKEPPRRGPCLPVACIFFCAGMRGEPLGGRSDRGRSISLFTDVRAPLSRRDNSQFAAKSRGKRFRKIADFASRVSKLSPGAFFSRDRRLLCACIAYDTRPLDPKFLILERYHPRSQRLRSIDDEGNGAVGRPRPMGEVTGVRDNVGHAFSQDEPTAILQFSLQDARVNRHNMAPNTPMVSEVAG
jgi:hypothetical protein